MARTIIIIGAIAFLAMLATATALPQGETSTTSPASTASTEQTTVVQSNALDNALVTIVNLLCRFIPGSDLIGPQIAKVIELFGVGAWVPNTVQKLKECEPIIGALKARARSAQ